MRISDWSSDVCSSDLPGTRSAIVWTVPKKRAPAMLALNERAFVAEMQKRIGGFLGEISLAAPRSSFPLGFQHSARIVDTRLALVRSEERRGGKECVSPGTSRWSTVH